MYWVKLTNAETNEAIYVNLDRFDTVYETSNTENGDRVTRITSTLSATEDDVTVIDVKEPAESFMGPPKMKVPDNG